MSGQGLKIDVEVGGESAMTFDELMEAIGTFVDRRVLVSIGDLDGNACGSVFGVLKRRLEVGEDSETGQLTVLDVGVNGLIIVSRGAFKGARWRHDEDGRFLALQNGEILLTLRRKAGV